MRFIVNSLSEWKETAVCASSRPCVGYQALRTHCGICRSCLQLVASSILLFMVKRALKRKVGVTRRARVLAPCRQHLFELLMEDEVLLIVLLLLLVYQETHFLLECHMGCEH